MAQQGIEEKRYWRAQESWTALRRKREKELNPFEGVENGALAGVYFNMLKVMFVYNKYSLELTHRVVFASV